GSNGPQIFCPPGAPAGNFHESRPLRQPSVPGQAVGADTHPTADEPAPPDLRNGLHVTDYDTHRSSRHRPEAGEDRLDRKRSNGMKKSGSQASKSPFQLIDARIQELGDWRGKMLNRLRTLVKEADPKVVEEWKWR